MKYCLLFPLASCGILESLGPIVQDPVIQSKITEAAVAAATGNYQLAAYSGGSALLAGLGLWFKKRMTKSKPGNII